MPAQSHLDSDINGVNMFVPRNKLSHQVDQARRLKELDLENQRLKRLVADQALDLSILKEASRGNF